MTFSEKRGFLYILLLNLFLLSEGLYNYPLTEADLIELFGDEECVEGAFSAQENGDPIKPAYVSAIPPQTSITKLKEKNDTITEKSPVSLLHELAEFNKINVQFILTDEKGPSHKKQFVISVKLGEEEYEGEGTSIKKAKNEASKLALNSTLYSHPPKQIKNSIAGGLVENQKKTPVQKLDDWAKKHNSALVTYSYFEQSQLMNEDAHENNYHKGMYSKAKNVFKTKVTIANKAFSGEGSSLEIAKHNAANNALKSLQSIDGFCMLTDQEASFFNKVFDSNSDSQNPITLVHEFGKISNMPVSFDLYGEEGPSHIKKFIFRCNVGDTFETYGEGSSKKIAKTEAADRMVQKLRIHATSNGISCIGTPKRSKAKKKKSNNLIKSVVKSYSEEVEDTNNIDLIPEDLDPVSKLFQFQQAKRDVLPVFTLLEHSNNKFSMEVKINDLSAIGTGPNKKSAKKAAAEAMLQKMGYSATYKRDESSIQDKKKAFSKGTTNMKHLAPGIDLNLNKPHVNEPIKSKPNNKNVKTIPKETLDIKDKSDSQPNSKKSDSHRKSNLKHKSQLKSLSQQIGFKYQFSPFPKVNNTEFISLLSLTTDPPKLCYGVGETQEQAEDKAARSALGTLYKSQLELISQILQEDDSPLLKTDSFIEEDNIVRSSIGRETD